MHMNKEYTGEERRKFKRVKASCIVMYRVSSPLSVRIMVGEREVNAIMLDISEGGAAILTNYNIPASTLLEERFILFNDKAIGDDNRLRSIETRGEARYSFLNQERCYRLGICFTDLSQNNRSFITNFVNQSSDI